MEFKMTIPKRGKIVKGTVFLVKDKECYVDIKAPKDGIIYKEHLTLEEIDSCKDVVNEGDELEFKITNVDDESSQILLSRIAVLRREKRKEFDEFAKKDEIFEAKVVKTNNHGLILRYKGVELFMPASHIDVKRVRIDDFKGKTLECKVIEHNNRRSVVSRKVVLREKLKQEKKEEYDNIEVGDVFTGKVVNVLDFGAFISIGKNDGLLHRSQISHYRVNNAKEVINVGDEVKVEVISKDKGKIGLSAKKLKPTPWQEFAEDHKVGNEVEGTIVKKMANAMLLEVAKEVVGIMNEKDYSWNPKDNLAGEVEEGDTLNVKILSIDTKKRRMSLSKKHLEYNPWKDVSVKVNEEVSGTVKEIQQNGAIVEVQGVNAFLPIGEISDEHVDEIANHIKVDEAINALVTELDKRNWHMKISIKALKNKKERETFKQYKKEEKTMNAPTLGEMFKEKFDDLKNNEH
ncbi:MAG: S1 RNA-binding domain-containing protein [Candidatus Izemoplasma sp.]|nr:S1 RNA-binding domain-containing protein [Candidatus Izemoplasma sp.]